MKQICDSFKIPFPTIYGVKSTSSKPIQHDDVEGMYFTEWIKTQISEIYSQDVNLRQDINSKQWFSLSQEYCSYGGYYGRNSRILQDVTGELGKDHPLTQHFLTFQKILKHWSNLSMDRQQVVSNIINFVTAMSPDSIENEAQKSRNILYSKYPLLCPANTGLGLGYLNSHGAAFWFDYIKLCDRSST